MMQISMEILSQMIARADSGSGVRQKAPGAATAESVFGKILDEKRMAMENPKAMDGGKSGKSTEKDDVMPVTKKTDEDIDKDAALIAGVMENHQEIVIILEGDKESATIPEMRIDAAAAIPDEVYIPDEEIKTEEAYKAAEVYKPAAGIETETDKVVPEPVVTEKANATDEQSVVNTVASSGAPNTVANTEGTAKADAAETSVINETGSAAGEVTARTPILRTSENQENDNDNSKFSEHGNLSPLENENETSPVKGQKEKTFSEIADAVRNTAENTQEPAAEVVIPIAAGIKSEQFVADQQMKQVVLDAPVKPDNLFDEMVSRIDTMQTETQNTMTIQLKPEFLGKVALEVAMDAAGLHVKISAEDTGVRAMINGQIAALVESLENKGIAVVEVEVAYTGVNNGAFKDSQESQAQQDRSKRTYRGESEPVENATYYAALAYDTLDYYLDTGVSSVEYRA